MLTSVIRWIASGSPPIPFIRVAAVAGILMGGWGCGERESSGVEAVGEASLISPLREAASLKLLSSGPIPDGGSYLFAFRSDQGAEFDIQAMHHDESMGGNSTFQIILVCVDGKEDLRVKPGGDLEKKIIALLSAQQTRAAAPATVDWLLARVKDRRLAWTRCP